MSGPNRSERRAFVARVSLTAYRWLLYAYPRDFRMRFAALMAEDCAALLFGSRGLMHVWGVLLRDLAISIPQDRKSVV